LEDLAQLEYVTCLMKRKSGKLIEKNLIETSHNLLFINNNLYSAPSIIYIDEIDTIGKNRLDSFSSKAASEHEQTLNQLLTEMDGMVSRQDVIVLASTNRSEVLDKALLRAGRFDRHILIDFPNLIERQEIFELHLKQINLDQDPSVYSHRLASMTPRCSGMFTLIISV
jgi:spastic paraplegia protein 7